MGYQNIKYQILNINALVPLEENLTVVQFSPSSLKKTSFVFKQDVE